MTTPLTTRLTRATPEGRIQAALTLAAASRTREAQRREADAAASGRMAA